MSKRRSLRFFTALFVGFLLLGALPDLFRPLDLIRPKKVTPAYHFAAAGENGKPLRLTDYRGKVVLLNFWATWCPPCREEMPAMQRLHDRYKGEGFSVIALSIDAEGAKVVGPFVKEHKLTFPVGLDQKMTIVEKFGVRALPSTFLIDREGRILGMALGPREWDGKDAQALVRSLVLPSKSRG